MNSTPITTEQAAQPLTCIVQLSARKVVKFVECTSLEQASKAMRAFIVERNLGASALDSACGTVRANGIIVARVSFNGRIWNV